MYSVYVVHMPYVNPFPDKSWGNLHIGENDLWVRSRMILNAHFNAITVLIRALIMTYTIFSVEERAPLATKLLPSLSLS